MKKLKKLYICIAVLLMTSVINAPQQVNAAVNMEGVQSYNTGIRAVPVPGEMKIDGDLGDWDRSGRIKMFQNIDTIEYFCNEMGVMYDNEYIYIYNQITDATPLDNITDPYTEGVYSWNGDSVQLRIHSDHNMWINYAYHSTKDVCSVWVDYWNGIDSGDLTSFNYVTEPGGTKLSTKSKEKQAVHDNPGEIKAVKMGNGKGYIMELKLSWKIVFSNPSLVKPNYTFNMGVDTNYGMVGKVGRVSTYQDNIIPGKRVNSFFWTAREAWGKITLSPTGNLTPIEYIPDAKLDAGSIPLEFDVPKTAKYISVNIEDGQGNIVCNFKRAAKITDDMVQSEKGDTKHLSINWDGRDNGGLVLPAGKYTIKALVHDGIDAVYDTYFYGPGQCPWGTGMKESWLSDHSNPRNVIAVNGDIFIAAAHCEGGSALIKVSEDGEKQWGNIRGAYKMTADDKYIYSVPASTFFEGDGSSGNYILIRVNQDDGGYKAFVDEKGEERDLAYYLSDILGIHNNSKQMPEVVGMTVTDDSLLIATSERGSTAQGKGFKYISSINVVDKETLIMKKRIKTDGIGDLATDKNGNVYGISGKGIAKVNIGSGTLKKLALKNLPQDFEPIGLAVDNGGNIVTFDKGSDMQIKVFNPNTGELVRTAGKKGGRSLTGKWDKDGLIYKVTSVAVDSRNRIWAVENTDTPRRVSVWNEDGTCEKEYIGGTYYASSGSALHAQDPDVAYFGPVEMKLDRENQTYEVTAVIGHTQDEENYQEEKNGIKNQFFRPIIQTGNYGVASRHFRSDASGKMREYIFQGPTYCNVDPSILFMQRDDGLFHPVFGIGLAGQFGLSKYSVGKALSNENIINENSFVMWNDTNKDGMVQREEVTALNDGVINLWLPSGGWTHDITDKLELIRGWNLWKPAYFEEDGTPVYTTYSVMPCKSKTGVLFGGNKCFYYDNEKIFVQDIESGKYLWTYKNMYSEVAGSHSAPMPEDGSVMGALMVLGHVNTQAGEIFDIRTNMGNDCLLTEDGFYLQTLFSDNRLARGTMPATIDDAIGFKMNDLTNGGEAFNGVLVKQDDGGIRVITNVGRQTAVIAKLEGFDTIVKTEPYVVNLTPELADKAKAHYYKIKTLEKQNSEAAAVSKEIVVSKVEPGTITIDGEVGDWESIGNEVELKDGTTDEFATVKLAYDSEKLYIEYTMSDDTPMANSAAEFQTLFKYGDMVDLCLSPSGNTASTTRSGDERIMMSMYKNKPVAVLARQIESSSDKNEYTYSSPVMNVHFDNVKILTEADIVIQRMPTGAVIEAAIPLTSLGLEGITSGKAIVGDLGIIPSDEDGMRNKARIYFYNKKTAMISDLPSESKLTPNEWGKIKFE